MSNDEIIQTLFSLLPRGGKHGTHHGASEVSGRGFVLYYLYNHSGSATPGELCRAMGVTGPRVTVILKEMEQQGIVERRTAREDRRSVVVELTDHGRQIVEKRAQQRRRKLEQLVEKIGPEDAMALIRILKAVEELTAEPEQTV